MSLALDTLQKYWKHPDFRSPQLEIIEALTQENDVFALLPTGAGKSICFQIPALLTPGTTLVVSPLIALIKDQVTSLSQKGIKATAISGSMSMSEIDACFDNCMYGNYKFLYISAERLTQNYIFERIIKLNLNYIAIDEAHCISQWGHDFRPAYLELSKLRQALPNVPIIALSASANNKAVEDICQILQLKQPKIFTKSFIRENLVYGVYIDEEPLKLLRRILQKNVLPSIVYVRTRKQTQQISSQLNALGFSSTYYHGGLQPFEKQKHMNAWMQEKVTTIVATNAFGMGIDKGNVKNVIHLELPQNLENYYQEAGRAGRNSQKAFATILLSESKIAQAKEMFLQSQFDAEFLKLVYKKLNNYLNIAYGEGFSTTYSFNFSAFCQHNKFPYTKTYNALVFLDKQGILKFIDQQNTQSTLFFKVPSSELLDFTQDNAQQEHLLFYLLREYNTLFEGPTEIDLEKVAQQIDLTAPEISKIFQSWEQHEMIQYQSADNDLSIVFWEAYEQERVLYRTFDFLKIQNKSKQNQFSAMLNYVENKDICKNKLLLAYFDQPLQEDCNTCSTCLSKQKRQ